MPYSNEENLIIQSTCNAVLLATLSAKGTEFIQSDFFKKMDFLFPKIQEMYEKEQIGVGNQGMVLVCLYSLLVLPKELILNVYPDEYKKVNVWIDKYKEEAEIDSYPLERYAKDLKHIYHLRNAVSHGNIEFDDTNRENVICIFKDKNHAGHEYQLKLSTSKVGELVRELCLAQQKYMDDLIARDEGEGGDGL